jgi:hypothetical protein
MKEKFLSWAALVAAAWTSFKLRLNIFQHPKLVRHEYNRSSEETTTMPSLAIYSPISVNVDAER